MKNCYAVTNDESIVEKIDSCIKQAVQAQASDIHFEPAAIGMRIRFRIDGVLYDQGVIPKEFIIDDQKGTTLVAVSDLGMKKAAGNKEMSNKAAIAYEVGKVIAEKSVKELKLSKVIFDKSGYDYHGRIKALADAARKGGLQF